MIFAASLPAPSQKRGFFRSGDASRLFPGAVVDGFPAGVGSRAGTVAAREETPPWQRRPATRREPPPGRAGRVHHRRQARPQDVCAPRDGRMDRSTRWVWSTTSSGATRLAPTAARRMMPADAALPVFILAVALAGILVSSAGATVRVTKRPSRVSAGDTASFTIGRAGVHGSRGCRDDDDLRPPRAEVGCGGAVGGFGGGGGGAAPAYCGGRGMTRDGRALPGVWRRSPVGRR